MGRKRAGLIGVLAVVAVLMLAGLAGAAEWETVGGSIASPSKTLLERVVRYVADNDRVALAKAVTGGGVILLKGGLPVFVEEKKGGYVKFRPKGETISLWALSEGIRRR